MIRGIGINCDDDSIDGRLERLTEHLDRAQAAGFSAYEFSIEAANVVRGGRVIDDELARLKDVMLGRPLHYTVHPPCELHLTEPSGLHRQVFRSCLEVTAAIGADVMVYHSAQIALQPTEHETRPLPTPDALADMWRRETSELKLMAREAAQRGVTIAVENRDPHLWEVAALHRHGKAPQDLLTYHQGMRLDLIVQQAQDIAAPNVGVCLDVGHAFLAAPYWRGTDYSTAITEAAPWVRHVHFHDNFGRLDDRAESLRERLVFGEADNHLPPGWGTIPLAEIVAILKAASYDGWLVVELRPRYMDHMAEVAATMRKMIENAALT